MSIWGAFLVVLTAVCLSLCLRGQYKDFAILISIAATVLIFSGTGGKIKEAVAALSMFHYGGSISDVFSLLIKALGITAVVRVASDICIQAGENTLATQIETFGTVEIVLLSLPMAYRLIEIAERFLS